MQTTFKTAENVLLGEFHRDHMRSLFLAFWGVLVLASGLYAQAVGPLQVHSSNPRYFTDGSGRVVYLTGAHTWENLMDSGLTDPPPVFDYNGYLDFLQSHNHNFFRLWRAENAKGGETTDNYWFSPLPYARTGPGKGLDGKPKFDLTQFDQAYFDRMRSRVQAAGQRGIYVSIMLFDGWSVVSKVSAHHPWIGHPFNGSNNINGINGDSNGNGSGEEIQTLSSSTVTSLEETYVRKVVDTVNDLDNVLYEISNESEGGATQWQYHMISYIKSYEAGKAKQHPVGMTVEWPGGNNAELFASPADWISPNGDVNNPMVGDGRKVIVNDTDHLCGICGDRSWVWKSFTQGLNPIFMDPYTAGTTARGSITGYDPNNNNDVSIRKNLGYALSYANRMNLAAMTPHPELASTGFCLANPSSQGAEYLVFVPPYRPITAVLEYFGVHNRLSNMIEIPLSTEIRVDLSSDSGTLSVEWFDPTTGEVMDGGVIKGGSRQSFSTPRWRGALLHLFEGSCDHGLARMPK